MHRTVLIMLLVIGDLASFAGCHREQKKMSLPLPKGTPKRPQGMTALTVKSGGEPFAKEDVVAYFKTHNFPKNFGATTEFQVDTFEFLTSKAVSERLQGVQTGLDDNARVAFVTLTGRFVFTGPPRTQRKEPTIFNRAYAVFDATNGNLMMVGTLDENKKRE
jgi:hypothetical protein